MNDQFKEGDSNVKIESSWKNVLHEEFAKPYFGDIKKAIKNDLANGYKVYPKGPLIFNAFDTCPIDALKVVIVGQDPYHGPNEAMGLSFSVQRHIRTPPSLSNIFKELHSDLAIPVSSHGDLTHWAKQGVFLLNAILTVRHKSPSSHKSIGWMQFTDAVIRVISEKKNGVVFLLWGRFAQSKEQLIDTSKHCILKAPHPSPLARGGFFGCKHFSKVNEYLKQSNSQPIDWELPQA